MKINIGVVVCAALLPFVLASACNDQDATAPALPPEVEQFKATLAAYSSPALAKAAGYTTAITDCMSNGDEGAMGIHMGNTAYIDAIADKAKPEILIFEPGNNGEMSLVGVEFIVPFSAVPKQSPAPTLFGQAFSQNDVFGVWALHVWTHRTNPKGMFAPWNTRVHC